MTPSKENGERLQKVLARVGLGSRRFCEDLIAAGRVTVDGQVAELGCRIEPTRSEVEVDGLAIGVKEDLVYYLLNKPAGIITTTNDPYDRPTVVDLVPREPRVFPVGRLDSETEGLLVLTNDGDLSYHLTHPSFGVEKEYLVEVEGRPKPVVLRRLREGLLLDDGYTSPAKVSQVDESLLKIAIHEGKNRQIRRMCEEVGHPVVRLVRTRIGPISNDSLSPGEFRFLYSEELTQLRQVIGEKGKISDGLRVSDY